MLIIAAMIAAAVVGAIVNFVVVLLSPFVVTVMAALIVVIASWLSSCGRPVTATIAGPSLPSVSSLVAVAAVPIEFTSAAAITMMHLSRMAEEMIIWTSAQFNFVDLPDRFCTG